MDFVVAALVSLSLSAPVHVASTREFPFTREDALGHQVVHASGFVAETGARRPEDAARIFLSVHGTSFGIDSRQMLHAVQVPATGSAGAVRFNRTIDGLPVFGGDLVIGVDGQNRVFAVNSGNVPTAISGRHTVGDTAAGKAARNSFANGARGLGPVKVAAGWRALGSETRAVYQVDFIAGNPAGDWRVYVDGETGVVLFREDRRRYATAEGSAFEVSPTETAAVLCPLSGTSHTICASPVGITLPNLSTGSNLTGTQIIAGNCLGASYSEGLLELCNDVTSSGGTFNFAQDATYRSAIDNFAAVMAYYHADRHLSYFKSLDPALPSGSLYRALTDSLPALVNVSQDNQPMDNAYYSPFLDAVIFGQGTSTDYAYDATAIYHELTHSVVTAWGDFEVGFDSLGGLDEPGAMNEGTADAMASSVNGHSAIGSFIGATAGTTAVPFLRDLADPEASRSCQGDGSRVTQIVFENVINGTDGEVHDDGEIWNGFYWELYQGLEAAGIKGCGGACQAGPALQYKALQLAAGTSPTFSSYWQTMKSAATALFPSQPEVAAYVDCVARRRGMDKCDRTVPVYAGESKGQYVRLRFSAFQETFQTTGPAQIQVCSVLGTATTAHLRKGSPVLLTGINPDTGAATVTKDRSVGGIRKCPDKTTITLDSASTWYMLLESAAALWPGEEAYLTTAGTSGIASRPTAAPPRTCTYGEFYLGPQSAQVPPRGQIQFTGTSGSGTGLVYALTTNGSGGSIEATTGLYIAGSTPSTTDVVQLTNSLSQSVTATVTVTAGVSVAPATVSLHKTNHYTFTASGGSGSGYSWSLATNASRGSIDSSTGVYTAGSTANVTDVIQVVDSLGNAATATVAVTNFMPTGGCQHGSASVAIPLMLLGWLTLRRRMPQP